MCSTVLSRQILPLTMKLVPTVTILSVRAKFQLEFFSHMHIPVRSGCLSCVNLWKLLNENIYPTFCAMESIFQHK